MSRRRGRPGGQETGWVKEKQVHGGTGEYRRKENTARQGVPVENLEQFARFLLPKIQAFYETEEGQRAFQEWKKRNKN